MKRNKIILAVLILTIVTATVVVFADTASPGSSEDPVVTKSYVDAQIAAIKSSGSTADSFQVVFVEKGKKVIGEEGTELILRGGTAVAVDNGTNGLSDLTAATELMGGAAVAKNHLLVVPRNDGRGISAQSDIYVMIKGGHTIK
ncbi:MAG: hypothetical protein PHQ50_03435 [Eubacteriales bacterium]|nr:hypothetical protein [Eubacteriales bacterium]MDD3349588.1 hypothetical protein [Eubacteriales bacterium]